MSDELRDREIQTDHDTHHNKRGIRNRSPQAMREPNNTPAVPSWSKRRARNPRICCSDGWRQRILYHICVNDLVKGEWRLTVLTSCHLDEWEANANKQIDYDGAALFRARDPYTDGGNFVESSVHAKRAKRNRNVEASLEMGDCETVIQYTHTTGDVIKRLPMSQ